MHCFGSVAVGGHGVATNGTIWPCEVWSRLYILVAWASAQSRVDQVVAKNLMKQKEVLNECLVRIVNDREKCNEYNRILLSLSGVGEGHKSQ